MRTIPTPLRGLSLSQPYASLVAEGRKTIETRKVRTFYRGPLLICATKTPDELARREIANRGVVLPSDQPMGVAVAVASVVGCRPLVEKDWPQSFFWASGRWAWLLADIRRVEPVPVRGMQGLFPLPNDLVLEAWSDRS